VKSKPNKLLAFLNQFFGSSHSAQPTGPAVYSGKLSLDVDQCCLEALTFAVQTVIQLKALNSSQVRCVAYMVRQLGDQVPTETRQRMLIASRHVAKQIEDRQQQKLFAAAMASPSKN
jgi:hypothetical protein